MEKEFINLKIGNQNVIKIDNNDDDTEEITCDEKSLIIKHNKYLNKKICYKCKINISKFFNRSEFICQYSIIN